MRFSWLWSYEVINTKKGIFPTFVAHFLKLFFFSGWNLDVFFDFSRVLN